MKIFITLILMFLLFSCTANKETQIETIKNKYLKNRVFLSSMENKYLVLDSVGIIYVIMVVGEDKKIYKELRLIEAK